MSKPPKRKIFPLEITYETSVLTLITFVISVVSLGWQIFNYLQGPAVRLISPDQIVIASSEHVKFPSRDGGTYVHFIPRMSYVNEGAAGYNSTLQRERIRIKMTGYPMFEHRWFRFVTHDATGPDGATINVEKMSDAGPIPMPAGSSASHATLFQPWPKHCSAADTSCDPRENYVTWQTFVERLKDKKEKYVIEFELLAETFGDTKPISARCTVEITMQAAAALIARGWGSPVCNTVARSP